MSARRMSARRICAVVPVKDTAQAKQRLAGMLSAEQRRELALAMAEDVLQTLASASELAGILVVTADPAAAAIAARYGARVTGDGARADQTAAVAAAAQRLAAEGFDMLALPGDIPLVEPADIARLLSAQRPPPAFTIVPARDQMGSNAVLCSPADAVPLRFGDDSFFPHLDAAKSARHRAAGDAASPHRARHRYARGPRAVPSDAVAHAGAHAARSLGC